jgi:endonuclease YncB( thermonuclease family)
VEKTDNVGARTGLRNMWAWYLARGLVMKLVIGFVAFMLILAPSPVKTQTARRRGHLQPRLRRARRLTLEASEKAEAEARAKEQAKAEAEARADAKAAEKAAASQGAARTYLVTQVIDGDTIELGNGQSVRVVGIDTPERGECGFDTATANMQRLVLGKQVRLRTSDEDTDRYGRLLRYVDVGKRDAGLAQIKRRARYCAV